MASHKSAIKAHRQSVARRGRNRTHRARLRTAVKEYRKAIAAGDAELAGKLLRPTLCLVDHTAKLGALHENAAARAKSRLTRALNRLNAA
jgi:small subunit ribosomal protein S20